jgi:hypothetical protein
VRNSQARPGQPSRGWAPGLLGLLLLALPAAAQLSVSGTPVLRLQVGEHTLEVELAEEAFRGEPLLLWRQPESLRGRLHTQPVDIGWSGGQLTGRVGDQPVRARVERLTSGAGLVLRGTFSGHSGRLVLQPTGLRGEVGGCGYVLTLAGNHYAGWRACAFNRGAPEPATLELPAAFTSLAPAEQAVLLALVLSAEVLPAPAPLQP